MCRVVLVIAILTVFNCSLRCALHLLLCMEYLQDLSWASFKCGTDNLHAYEAHRWVQVPPSGMLKTIIHLSLRRISFSTIFFLKRARFSLLFTRFELMQCKDPWKVLVKYKFLLSSMRFSWFADVHCDFGVEFVFLYIYHFVFKWVDAIRVHCLSCASNSLKSTIQRLQL